MLQNAYFLAKIGADTAENERNFAEICQKLATTLRGRVPRRQVLLRRGVLLPGRAGHADLQLLANLAKVGNKLAIF